MLTLLTEIIVPYLLFKISVGNFVNSRLAPFGARPSDDAVPCFQAFLCVSDAADAVELRAASRTRSTARKTLYL